MTGRLPVLRRLLYPSDRPLTPSLARIDWEGEVEPPCSVFRGNDGGCLGHLAFPFKTEEPQKRNRYNASPLQSFSQMICVHLVTATAHIVWLSSDRSWWIFLVQYCFIASKTHEGYSYYC